VDSFNILYEDFRRSSTVSDDVFRSVSFPSFALSRECLHTVSQLFRLFRSISQLSIAEYQQLLTIDMMTFTVFDCDLALILSMYSLVLCFADTCFI